jgi:uncharacterized phage-associated protein
MITGAGGASARTVAAVLAVLDTAREYGYTVTRTTLAKLLFFADLESVKQGGDPVSGLEWRWRHHGPYDNILLRIEDELVVRQQVESIPYFETGRRLQMAPTRNVFSYVDTLGSEDLETIRLIVHRMGNYAVATIRDLSYQTEPMRDAQRRGRESVINLELARPVPKIGTAVTRARRLLATLPPQEDDPGVQDQIVTELESMAEERAATTARLLGDD